MIAKIKEKGKPFFNPFFIIFTFFLIGLLIFSNFKINKKREELGLFFDSLKKEIQSLGKENEKLKGEIALFQKESFWEEKIREQGYQKPGEKTIVVLPPKKEKKEEKGEEKGFWQGFFQIKEKLLKFFRE